MTSIHPHSSIDSLYTFCLQPFDELKLAPSLTFHKQAGSKSQRWQMPVSDKCSPSQNITGSAALRPIPSGKNKKTPPFCKSLLWQKKRRTVK
jgi:hypothetical protein